LGQRSQRAADQAEALTDPADQAVPDAPALHSAELIKGPTIPNAFWDTSCPDWEERLLSGRSLVPDLPLFRDEADRALRIFKRLRMPDVIGTPTMSEACGDWFYPIVAAIFGSYDPDTNRRAIQEFFWLIPKKNSKSSNGGTVMVVMMRVTAPSAMASSTRRDTASRIHAA
jgi:hypothetical protein